jgi:hypothetical protein
VENEENCYEALRGEIVVASVTRPLPASRGYDQAQAHRLFEEAGFADVKTTSGDSFDPGGPDEVRFKICGVRG